jgi:antitoxin YefM
MTTIMVMTETYSLAHIKAHLSALVELVEREHERVVLTKNGRPAAVLISIEELESIEETLDILSDPDALREIRAGEKDIAEGRGIPLDDIKREFLAE